MISVMRKLISWNESVSVKHAQRIIESFLKNWITSTRILFLFQENVSTVGEIGDLVRETKE
jgi:hypothetical protein